MGGFLEGQMERGYNRGRTNGWEFGSGCAYHAQFADLASSPEVEHGEADDADSFV